MPKDPALQALPLWQRFALYIICWGIMLPTLAIGALLVIGLTIETQTEYRTQLEHCQRTAITPYEYSHC